MSIALPALYEAVLDPAGLTALFADVASCGTDLELAIKAAADARAHEAAASSLEQARASLLQGTVRAVQLRYTHAGRRWCDTLLATPNGVRLVRMEQPSAHGL